MQHGGEVPKMLFENNAKIAGRYFDQKLGVLEEGAAADVIIVNYNPLTPMNENNINGHLVFWSNWTRCCDNCCKR